MRTLRPRRRVVFGGATKRTSERRSILVDHDTVLPVHRLYQPEETRQVADPLSKVVRLARRERRLLRAGRVEEAEPVSADLTVALETCREAGLEAEAEERLLVMADLLRPRGGEGERHEVGGGFSGPRTRSPARAGGPR